jgi:hypothetical protein
MLALQKCCILDKSGPELGTAKVEESVSLLLSQPHRHEEA